MRRDREKKRSTTVMAQFAYIICEFELESVILSRTCYRNKFKNA